MGQTDKLWALEYRAEVGWAENVSSFDTYRPAILGQPTLALTHDSVDPERAVQQLQGGTTPILGPKGGSFTFRVWATGHGVTTDGAVTIDANETFKGLFFGNPVAFTEAQSPPTRSATASTTVNGAGSTVSNLVTTASGTFARNSLIRVGAGGATDDARGKGQFYLVNNHTGTNLAIKNETFAAAANADKVFPAINFYFPETVLFTAVRGLRFRFLSGDKQYITRGCWPMRLSLQQTDVGQRPFWEVEMGVSEWDSTSSGTFPSTLTTNTYNPAPIGGGGLHVQDTGVTTRNMRNARGFRLDIELGIVPIEGHGGVWPYQTYVAAVRTPSKIRASWIETAADGHATWEAKYLAQTAQTVVWSGSIAAATALGVGLQNFKLDKRPIQISHNGINSVQLEGYACSGTDVTTELSQAALVVGYA